MNLFFMSNKIIQYYKWKLLIYSVAVIGISIFITLQIQQVHHTAVQRVERENLGETQVILYQQLQDEDFLSEMTSFFKGISFSVMSITAVGMILIMSVLYDTRFRKRLLESSVGENRLIREEIVIGLLLVPFALMLHVAAAYIVVGGILLSIKGILLFINTMMLSVSCVGMVFMFIRMSQDKNTLFVSAHMIILTMCFISGAFLPGYYLGTAAREFAVFTPVYWYIKAIDAIRELQFSELSRLLEILQCFGMQIVFGVTFYVLAAAVKKQSVQSE